MYLSRPITSERSFTMAVAVAFAIKATLSVCTFGTNDMLLWHSFLQKISSDGGIALYRDQPLFNHPPFMIHLLRLWGGLDLLAGIPLQISLRMTSVLADVGTAWLIWKLVQARRVNASPGAMLVMVLSPISILVAGFHGNTDPLMMFLVIAAIYLAETGQSAWLVGLFLGAAMNIKIVPVLLAPSLFFWMEGMRNRVAFVTGAGLAFLVGSLPFIVLAPRIIFGHVFGYTSLIGQWSWALPWRWLSARFGMYDAFLPLINITRIGLLLSIVGVSIWMNRARSKPRPYLQCGLVFFLFLAASAGFGIQYLTWLVVWTLALGLRISAAFHATCGIFLFAVYHFWARGFPWYLADSTLVTRRPWHIIVLGEVVWLFLVVLAWRYFQLVREARLHPATGSTSPAERCVARAGSGSIAD